MHLIRSKPEPPLKFIQKLKYFLIGQWRGLLILLVPLLMLPVVMPLPGEAAFQIDTAISSHVIWMVLASPAYLYYFRPNGDDPVTRGMQLKLFLRASWRGLVCFLGPIFFLFLIFPSPVEKYAWCGYTLLVMAVFWVTECIPLPVTAFLPIIIFPLNSIMTTNETCRCYFNDTVILFLGSIMLATGVEQSGLHVRLALWAIRSIGYSHYKLLFAMSFITMFVSMWITNTAATTMMVPINFALLKVFEDQRFIKIYEKDSGGEQVASPMTVCYFCSATYSATIGGIGTLVGTGTNLAFKGLFVKAYPKAPEHLSFPLFSAFTIPIMILMEAFSYFSMIIVYFGLFRSKSKAAKDAQMTKEGIIAAKNKVQEQWNDLGKVKFWEIMVIFLFGGAMIAFFCRSPQIFEGWGDKISSNYGITDTRFVLDSACAMFASFCMFFLPAYLTIFKNCTVKNRENLPKGRIRSVLDFTHMNKVLPYSFLFLLGGGFALSTAAKPEYTNLNGKIGDTLKSLSSLPNVVIIFIIILFTVFVTNFASNVAVCNVIAPIAMELAMQVGQNPLWYNVAAGLAASYCYMLPVGTPGNLIVQSAAKISTKQMIVAGVGPTISTIIINWLFVSYWAPVIWSDIKTFPDWVK